MSVLGLSHVGICVSNLDRSLEFYARLGFRLLGRVRVDDDAVQRLLELNELDMELAFIELGEARLELIHFRRPAAEQSGFGPFNRTGLTHLSVKVTDFDATVRKLESDGVSVRRHTIGSNTASNARFAFLTDPDGMRIELFGAVDEETTKPWDMFAAG